MGSPSSLPPIRACLFDMDGLLIDSEDLYTLVVNTVLHELGRPSLPWSIKAQMQGRPASEATKIFREWANLPISEAEYLARISALQTKHFPTTQPLPGALDLINTLSKTAETENPVHIALATSSHRRNYLLKTEHLGHLFSLFPPSRIVIGDDPRIGAGRGKPRPDIYLLALEVINQELRTNGKGEPEIKPEECLVFEDSVPGVEAGRRAGMRVIWCPHEGLLKEYRGKEDQVLAGLTGEHKDLEQVDELNKNATEPWRAVGAGKPGAIGDGWADLLPSLENFPYEKYGMKV